MKFNDKDPTREDVELQVKWNVSLLFGCFVCYKYQFILIIFNGHIGMKYE